MCVKTVSANRSTVEGEGYRRVQPSCLRTGNGERDRRRERRGIRRVDSTPTQGGLEVERVEARYELGLNDASPPSALGARRARASDADTRKRGARRAERSAHSSQSGVFNPCAGPTGRAEHASPEAGCCRGTARDRGRANRIANCQYRIRKYDTIPRNFARTRGRLDASAAGARDRHRARESGPDHGPDGSTAVVGDSTTGPWTSARGQRSDGPALASARRVVSRHIRDPRTAES